MTDTPESRTSVANYLAANRKPLATLLLMVGAIFAVLGLYAIGAKSGLQSAISAKKEKEPDPAEKIDPDVLKVGDATKVDYAVSGVLGLFAGLALVAVGVWVMNRPMGQLSPTDARVALLTAGGSLGFFLMVLGLWLSYSWFQPLVDWLDKGERKEAKWPVLAVAVFLLGGTLAFFSAQPARAEERANPTIRRLVYASNLVLSALLLLVALTAVNVFVSMRVPNALDTTEGGFYTYELSEATKDYLAKLDRPVTAYVTIPRSGEDHITRDTYRLLEAAAAANPDKFRVRPLTPTNDRDEFLRLATKFPQANMKTDPGILLVAGEDESAFAFIRDSDLGESQLGRQSRDVFQGEARLTRELLFLAEGKTKAVVYFTAGSGELSVAPGDRSQRAASRLRTVLEKNNVEVKTLTAGIENVTVPDDAAMVVVADPTQPLPEKMIAAIQKYMTQPEKNGKKGKMVLLAGPHPKPGTDKGVAATGLEEMLTGLGVRLDAGYLLGQSSSNIPPQVAICAPNDEQVMAGNPIALAFGNRFIGMPNSRCVETISNPAGPITAAALLSTPPGGLSWIEHDPPVDPAKTLKAMRENSDLIRVNRVSQDPRTLAVVVKEGDVGRAIVFGCGEIFIDNPGRGGSDSSFPAEMFANSVDWLRDRPAVANIANKTYGRYNVKPDVGFVRGTLLPVGLVLFAVLALGTGVWVTRRK